VTRLSAVALATLTVLVASCGGSSPGAGTGGSEPTVFAAASLTEVFRRLDPNARFNFAGSDELASQIEDGAPADVYAAASPRYADRLYAAGVIERPRPFATNTLVIVVPCDNPAGVRSVADLTKPDTKVVVGAQGVPIGDYTRDVLERLHADAVLRNVVSEEQDVKGVLAKVVSGDADAGFVYATDAKIAGSAVRAVAIAPAAQPTVEYPIAVVAHPKRPAAARRFVALVLSSRGRAVLGAAGFGPP
jgi:molybdate transport system substrate-binding protein